MYEILISHITQSQKINHRVCVCVLFIPLTVNCLLCTVGFLSHSLVSQFLWFSLYYSTNKTVTEIIL